MNTSKGLNQLVLDMFSQLNQFSYEKQKHRVAKGGRNMFLHNKRKYGNIKTIVDGIKFDSKKEAKRYVELQLMEKAGEISVLRLQVTFILSVCKYKADFVYYDKTNNLIVEDCKGMKTPVYNLKKKMMKHELGISILET